MKHLKTAICLEVLVMCMVFLLDFLAIKTNNGSFYREDRVELVQAGIDTKGSDTEISDIENVGTVTTDTENADLDKSDKNTMETTAGTMLPQAKEIIQYAEQFVGNPYVWGGTSLTEGADCSGFVQSVYNEFGISLPRTSREQAVVGEQIALEDASPGDLIFYAEDGVVYHVVIYIGDGQSVQAMSTAAGIVTAPVDYESAVWAVRVL